MPEPFGRKAIVEALDVLVRRFPAAGGAGAEPPPAALAARTLSLSTRRSNGTGALGVSCLGAGNYVRAVLFHHLRRSTRVLVRGVMDIRPEVAAAQARALHSGFCTTDPEAVFGDALTNLVLIASDHASHADYAVSALRAGKAVHLEKPPAVTAPQLERLLQCLGEVDRPRLSLGYNRPFAPAVIDLGKVLDSLDGPTRIDFTVQGYRLGRAHWYRWPDQGTRIAGNLVHWIDLGYRLVGRPLPSWVDVSVPTDPSEAARDAIVLSVGFEDDSRITIRFSSGGDETWGMREHVRVEKKDLTAEIDDFLSLRIRRAGLEQLHRYRRDKGHAAFVQALALRMRDGKWDPGTVKDTARACAIQLAAQAALAEGGGRRSVREFLPARGR
jgi:predicted dehydrogenase